MISAKYQTLMQRHGFADGELKTPEHDRLLFWLKSNAAKLIDEWFARPWDQKEIARPAWRGRQQPSSGAVIPSRPAPKLEKMIDESPLITADRREYLVGYLDLMARISVPFLILIDGLYEVWWEQKAVGFEVKTAIRSYGELLRQLRTYERFFDGKIAVVSPDDRFREAILEQGFHFIKCDLGVSQSALQL